jgi:hypothetical protein
MEVFWMRYRVKGNGIIHELLNDEAIIANLDTGVYYSIRGVGVPLWRLLIGGLSREEVEAACRERYGEESGVYQNNLKNRDFGQEAPRCFDPERATIAPEAMRERGSEQGGKLTTPKTDSSGCFGIAPFIAELVKEGLLEEEEERAADPLPEMEWPARFSPPFVERYDEMKNLLMLDPIHEVDEQGWPSRSPR